MKFLYILSLLFISVLFFSGCSGNLSKNNSNGNDFIELQEQTIQLSLKLNNNIINTYSTDYNISKEMIGNSYSMMESFEDIVKKTELSLIAFEEFTNNITQEFTLNEMVDVSDPLKSYFMVSGSSPFLNGSNTVKTLFNNSISLDKAWQRAIEFSEDKNLFIRIYEISSDGSYKQVSKEMMIPKSEVLSLRTDQNI